MAFHRGAAADGFKVDRIEVSRPAATASRGSRLATMQEGRNEGDERIDLSADAAGKARYVKFAVKKADDVERMLLGEIEIVAPAGARAAPSADRPRPPRPMHVKKTLDEALLEAGVAVPLRLLRDRRAARRRGPSVRHRDGQSGRPPGGGGQDDHRRHGPGRRGSAGRSAKFRPYPAGEHTFKRVVIGGEAADGGEHDRADRRAAVPGTVSEPGGHLQAASSRSSSTRSQLPMADDSPASWAAADQQARTMTYHPEQQFTSDDLFEVPPDPMRAETLVTQAGRAGRWRLAVRRASSRPVSIVCTCSAAVPMCRASRRTELRPPGSDRFGRSESARPRRREAKTAAPARGCKVGRRPTDRPAAPGDVREILDGVRPVQELPTVPQEARALPVLGQYDVVVIGGGTAGAPAGIGAARAGAKTLRGRVPARPGRRRHRRGDLQVLLGQPRRFHRQRVRRRHRWVIEQKMEWWRSETLEGRGRTSGSARIGCGAFVA